ncbi:Zinc finger BED domain-containing protein DAYSLEEPER [Linum perenne]
MLESAEPYEEAFKFLEADDLQFVPEMCGKKYDNEVIGPPTHEDWVNVRKLLPFLEAFDNLTLVVSGTKYVTAHMCFDEIYKIFNHIRKMKNFENRNISDMAGSMLQKLGKYSDEKNGNNAKLNKLVYIASVFDPRHKLHYAKFAFTKLYGPSRTEIMLSELKMELSAMFMVYQAKHVSTTSSTHQTSGSLGSTSGSPTHTKLERVTWGIAHSVEHLDDYLVDINYYSFRSSLSPEIVEALICSGDWFRSANSSSQNVREYEDDLAELEDVVVACATNMDSNEEVLEQLQKQETKMAMIVKTTK